MPGASLFSRDTRIVSLIGTGHFLSHFYVLCLPPLFIAWQGSFGVSFAELGLSVALMGGTTAVLQTPVGFLVDRYGARPFLVGGTLLMSLSLAAMSMTTAFWQILALSLLSGIGNSVIHPADYAILAGSVDRNRIGRSFALHTFSGNLGFAASPPATALLMLLVGWRGTLAIVGLLGIPVVLLILWQSQILQDQARPSERPHGKRTGGGAGALLLTPTMLLFFGFFLLGSMATAGLQAWLITVLHQVHGMDLRAAATVLTFYMIGATSGVLVGGWVADRTDRHLPFTIIVTVLAAGLMLAAAALPLHELLAIALFFAAGLFIGASRTPRDVMVKNAAPRGQIGKVFGFVSAGLPLGQALTPVPFGFLIDAGRPDFVLVLIAVILLASLFFVGSAKATVKDEPLAAAAE